MAKLVKAKTAVIKFLADNIQCQDITVVKMEKTDTEWHAIAEVYEDDSFLKSMNMPPKKNRVFYSVTLDEDLEATAYERHPEYPQQDD